MANQIKELKKGELLFREGDPSDAMYIIKKGKIAIVKTKGTGEVELAELGPGELVGEMAFFDNKSRSAGARAKLDSSVIVLPFTSLFAQFKTFPEWMKALVKNVNGKLRTANAKIKNLESESSADATAFTPHLVTRLCAIITLVGNKYGEKTTTGVTIAYSTLRNYCIQIFQTPTNKLDKMMEALQGFGILKVEDIGQGRKKVTLVKFEFLSEFVDWYNSYLFEEESKRVTIDEKELPVLKALVFYGRKQKADDKGLVTVSLTDMQINSMSELGQPFNLNDTDSLVEKNLVQEKHSGEGGAVTQTFSIQNISTLASYWELVFALEKVES